MKKKLLALLLTLSLLASQAFAVNLYVDGQRLYPDAEPVIVDGRTLVPLRVIFEALNAQVTWDGAENAATAVRDGIVLKTTVGSLTALVNGEEKPLDVPAQIIQDRTFVPVRFVAESLNAEVSWDAETQTVYIDTPFERPAQDSGASSAPAVQPKPQAPAPSAPQVSEKSADQDTVYVTKTGKRYHYSSTCNGGTYYPSTLKEAQNRGLTPCNKCVN